MLKLKINGDGADTPMLRIPRSAQPVPTIERLQTRRMPVMLYVGTVAVLIPALIALGVSAGWFRTNGRVDENGRAIELTAASTGADIRGWMTLVQLETGLGVTDSEFVAAFPGAKGADAALKLGELSEAGAFALEDIRTWVDAGMPVTSSGATAVAERVRPTSSNPPVTPQPTPTGDGAGPALRGRDAVADALSLAGEPLSAFVAAFALDPAIATTTQLSQLVNAAGEPVSVEDVRAWVDAR